LLYIYDPTLYTLPVGLEILKQMDITNIPLIMAAAIIMVFPVLLIFWFLQRFIFHELSLSNIFQRDI
ncbi:MAG: carbohydrate ABC transporter permease, partial [Aliifodinibius sp.]|nr:carbohydrate ABC transporter permease [candidate division Zixibacteria bacterium]NIS48228.1 carbohydrate ABC transporter permease [candidate division Zixibacteria bacterium]NIT60520.1 carbohydrate ABC transporter permease [Fodinibius sp.]NIV15236.1 carbohydrate ABC transporter permease [Fodinibius sp.]NIY29102.1 carbohydrate ABC transporter permease [Fodinibius sp.]